MKTTTYRGARSKRASTRSASLAGPQPKSAAVVWNDSPWSSIGPGRFVFGTQWPLRLSQAPRANLDLLPPDLTGAQLADPERLFS